MIGRDIENVDTVYFEVAHVNYWLGVYGLDVRTSWEDVRLYREAGEDLTELDSFSINSRTCMRHYELGLDPSAEGLLFDEHIRTFVNDGVMRFHIIVEHPERRSDWMVTSSTDFMRHVPCNTYAVMWHPCAGIDLQAIRDCIASYCAKFYNFVPRSIQYARKVSFDDAVRMRFLHPRIGMAWSDRAVIANLARTWRTSERLVEQRIRLATSAPAATAEAVQREARRAWRAEKGDT